MKIWEHKYPQSIWASEIVKLLKSNPDYSLGIIVDAPCGNGIIGNLISKELDNPRILLLDNDTSLSKSPYVINEKMDYRIEDIFEFHIEGDDHTWLLINSLYCLPDSDKLISGAKDKFKYVIAVFPDIKSANYKYFIKKNPNFSNPSAIDIESTINLFKKHGYDLESKSNNTKVAFHKWNGFFDAIKLPFIFKNIIYLTFDNLLFFLSGHYTIIAFKRSE